MRLTTPSKQQRYRVTIPSAWRGKRAEHLDTTPHKYLAASQLIAELRSLGVTSKLDGTEDDAIHIRVAASLMPTGGLQSLAEARLLELARISREEEEKSAAHAARIWQENKAVKEENASKRYYRVRQCQHLDDPMQFVTSSSADPE